ncbi:MAG: inositol monophosphatase family protein [candidate division WOR-3 bacterium]
MIKTFLKTAITSAYIGGNILKFYFKKQIEFDEKFYNDYVSKADIESENAIKNHILEHFKDHEIICEESGRTGKSDYVWYIDPLDGTKNFLRGLDSFCVSIALSYKNEIILGVVYEPIKENLYYAVKNEGSYKNNSKIWTSKRKTLRGSFLATGFPHRELDILEDYVKIFKAFSKYASGIRRIGSAALDLCMLAEGIFDGFWEYKLNKWDIAAGIIIIKEAGGIISDFEGKENYFESGNLLCSCNEEFHKEMLEVIRNALQFEI